MKRKLKRAAAIAAGLTLLLGATCNSWITTIQHGEITGTHLLYTAYVGWTNYYSYLTNKYVGNIPMLAQVEAERERLKQVRLDYSASVYVLDSWIAAYQTNSAFQRQVQAAFEATLGNSSNFLYLYNVITNKY